VGKGRREGDSHEEVVMNELLVEYKRAKKVGGVHNEIHWGC